ncbi:hypothetical protein SAMN05216412_106112 [Nitrosospira multiformis]|uniref:Uncharacterized protein n=1 Tax=Nitrosospira multiformis TaxID=1231 RepID=A0A1I0ECF2_9PROT|nr:hypothetical protein SAMN05216412_106112 [Nitrosospira multiformis]
MLTPSQSPLVANLFLVAHGQNHCSSIVIAIQGYIAAILEVDDLLSILWLYILAPATDTRLVRKHFHAFADRLDGSLGSSSVLVREEAIQALHVLQRLRRPDQRWHSGGSMS